MLIISEITVVRYFFLLLFKFFKAISPSIPKNNLINFDVLSFFPLIFISSFPRIASTGLILLARFAGIITDK